MTLLPLLLACAHLPPPWREVRAEPPVAEPADPDEVRLAVVSALVDQGSWDRALEAIAAYRADGLAGRDLGLLQARALLGAGLPEEALDLLQERPLRRDPAALLLVARAQADLDDLDAAVATLRRALRRLPRPPDAAARARVLNDLGFLLAARGDLDEALTRLEEAVRLAPSTPRYRNNLGFALALAGEDERARRAFEAAAGLQLGGGRPETVEAMAAYHLGLARQARGDPAGARVAFARALRADPSFEPAARALDGATPPPEHP